MSKAIQVRNVPDRLHAELVGRARARGHTLTELLTVGRALARARTAHTGLRIRERSGAGSCPGGISYPHAREGLKGERWGADGSPREPVRR